MMQRPADARIRATCVLRTESALPIAMPTIARYAAGICQNVLM